jgi:hypothetical protein
MLYCYTVSCYKHINTINKWTKITKKKSLTLKRATTTPPPAQPCRGEGGRGVLALWPWRFALKKLELHLNYHQKHTENDFFNGNLWNKKVCSDFLRGIFDFFKNILLTSSMTYFYFYKKGFLNSQAVRIRVKAEPSSPPYRKIDSGSFDFRISFSSRIFFIFASVRSEPRMEKWRLNLS